MTKITPLVTYSCSANYETSNALTKVALYYVVAPKVKLNEKKKKRKEAKRKRFCPDSNSRPSTHRAKALPLVHVEHRKKSKFIIKTFEPY